MAYHSVIKSKVVLVPFPFDDLSSAKLRPAVCLTNPIGIHSHVVLAFITSRLPENKLKTDIVIDTQTEDFSTTGLHVTSTIKLHRLMTVSTSIIQRELGCLSSRLESEVNQKLLQLFDLNSTAL